MKLKCAKTNKPHVSSAPGALTNRVNPVHVTVKLVSIQATTGWPESSASTRRPAYVLRMERWICQATALLSVSIMESARVMIPMNTLVVFARMNGKGKNS